MSNHWIKKQESNLAGEHSPAVGLIDVPCDFVLMDLTNIREARFDLIARCAKYWDLTPTGVRKDWKSIPFICVNKEK